MSSTGDGEEAVRTMGQGGLKGGVWKENKVEEKKMEGLYLHSAMRAKRRCEAKANSIIFRATLTEEMCGVYDCGVTVCCLGRLLRGHSSGQWQPPNAPPLLLSS